MTVSLHQLKAEFFKTLAHTTRIRALELLTAGECSVGELGTGLGIEASTLSQQLGVLRRSGLVTCRREGSTVFYSLTSPEVAELLSVARRILATVLSGHAGLLTDLRAESSGAPGEDGGRTPRTPGRLTS